MILGDSCSRNCRFCAVEKGVPLEVDPDEPGRVAVAAEEFGLKYVVITSVTRDDLSDGGAKQFAFTINAVRKRLPTACIEVLIPDFNGEEYALQTVCHAKPDMLNHNIETVPRLYPQIRPQAEYQRSLSVLNFAAIQGLKVKSGLIIAGSAAGYNGTLPCLLSGQYAGKAAAEAVKESDISIAMLAVCEQMCQKLQDSREMTSASFYKRTDDDLENLFEEISQMDDPGFNKLAL